MGMDPGAVIIHGFKVDYDLERKFADLPEGTYDIPPEIEEAWGDFDLDYSRGEYEETKYVGAEIVHWDWDNNGQVFTEKERADFADPSALKAEWFTKLDAKIAKVEDSVVLAYFTRLRAYAEEVTWVTMKYAYYW